MPAFLLISQAPIALFSRRQRSALDSFRERPGRRREGTRDSRSLTPVLMKILPFISHPQKVCQSLLEISGLPVCSLLKFSDIPRRFLHLAISFGSTLRKSIEIIAPLFPKLLHPLRSKRYSQFDWDGIPARHSGKRSATFGEGGFIMAN